MAKDAIVRLKVDSKEYDSKIERARSGMLRLEDSLRKAGKTFADADKDQVAFVRDLGKMPTQARTASGAVSELTKGFTDLSLQYKRMTDQERQSPFGQALKGSLDELKGRIQTAKAEIRNVQGELGGATASGNGLKDCLSQLGSQFGISGDAMSLLTTGTIAYTAAVGAAVAAVVAATKAWADYNSELNRQQQVTTVTTGLQGPDADRMTSEARALAATYGVDFRDAVNAANTLMTQFGTTGAEAMRLLRDGMQGMIQGDGPKMLQMIQNFGPAFQSAGVSASQLVAVIHNTEGGIFTDQNMQNIVIGMQNLRNVTDATAEALWGIGINAREMGRMMNDGTITVFDALRIVSEALDRNKGKVEESGAVMQAVFGRQGAMAGTNLGKAIATLNTNLDETKRQTGELGEAFSELNTASQRLDEAIRKAAGVDDWEKMTTAVKTDLVGALATMIEKLSSVKEYLSDIAGINVWDKLVSGLLTAIPGFGTIINLARQYLGLFNDTPEIPAPETPAASVGAQADVSTDTDVNAALTATGNYTKPVRNTGDGSRQKEVTLQQQIAGLEKEALTASAERREEISAQIRYLDIQIQRQKDLNEQLHAAKTKTAGEPDPLFAQPMLPQADPAPLDGLKQRIADALTLKDTEVDTATLTTLVTTAIQNGLDQFDGDFTSIQEAIGAGIDVPDETWQELQDKINEKLAEMGIDPIVIDLKTGGVKNIADDAKKMTQSWQAAGAAIQAVGNAMSQIEDPAAKIMGTIAQAIAAVALGAANALASSKDHPETQGWAWIAYAASVAAAMVGTITAIHSATGYAGGGIVDGRGGGFVGGTAYSGDNIGNVRLDAGELVLNRAQQGVIASELEGAAARDIRLSATISGEDIILTTDNTNARRGYGEYVHAQD